MSVRSATDSGRPLGRDEETRAVAGRVAVEALAPVESNGPHRLSGEAATPPSASVRRLFSARRPVHDEATLPWRRRTSVVVASDFASTVGAIPIGLLIMAGLWSAPGDSAAHLDHNALAVVAFPVIALPLFAIYGLYRRRNRRVRHSSFGDLVHLVHALAVTAIVTFFVSRLGHHVAGLPAIGPAPLALIAACALVAVPTGRGVNWWLGARVLNADIGAKPSADRVLIVGSGTVADQIRRFLTADHTINVVGCVDDDPTPGSATLGCIADVPRISAELQISRILIGFSRTHPLQVIEQLRPVQGRVAISIVPRYFELLSWRSQMDEISGLPIIDVAPLQMSLMTRFVKRSFDVVGAATGLLLLTPLFVFILVMIKMSSPGPLLFRQERIGRGGRSFTIYKFRTMNVDAESERESLSTLNDLDGEQTFKMHVDPRTYAFGRFLRRLSLDETPQFLNVLRGDMSLIGPRPFIHAECEHLDGWAARRFDVRPGLSGLWQISGRNDLSFDELRRLDYVYVASWSFWWDLKILWLTPGSVLRRRGAY